MKNKWWLIIIFCVSFCFVDDVLFKVQFKCVHDFLFTLWMILHFKCQTNVHVHSNVLNIACYIYV